MEVLINLSIFVIATVFLIYLVERIMRPMTKLPGWAAPTVVAVIAAVALVIFVADWRAGWPWGVHHLHW